ncbi:MAG: ABC transporter substrate-binding protein [Acidimicrobiales bacterium]
MIEAVISSFTGPEAFIGQYNAAADYAAAYAINQAGGILGHTLNVDTVDTRGDPADALPLVERFLGTHNIEGWRGLCAPNLHQPVLCVSASCSTARSRSATPSNQWEGRLADA